MITAFDAVLYTLAFIVPGFICDSVLSATVRRRAVAKRPYFENRPVQTALAWTVVVFISAIVIGLVLGVLRQRNLIRTVLEHYGIYTTHHRVLGAQVR